MHLECFDTVLTMKKVPSQVLLKINRETTEVALTVTLN